VRRRLDQLLVDRGLTASRARARDAILRGAVVVDGVAATKPGAMVDPAAVLAAADPAAAYVSRAALKLVHALDRFGIDPAGLYGLDIGASAGGFTQVLLERGAAHVTAVDVGHGQLAPALAEDARVTAIEGLNARDLAARHSPAPPQLVVCDVSFISLTLALPPALALAAPGARLVALIKPQFEAGRAAVGKTGVIRDPGVHQAVCARISAWIEDDQGWRVLGVAQSPLIGGDGNREFLLAARKP
jgi:23S rRNA (cytidine1920-2'-O)/16S rRNA (cytidine1409-2'-O)-methyltransferase